MSKRKPELVDLLAGWIGESFKSFFALKTLSANDRKANFRHAEELLKSAATDTELGLFFKGTKPAGLFRIGNHTHPRMKNQQVIELYYDRKVRSEFLKWLKPQLLDALHDGPIGLNINFVPGDEIYFTSTLERAGGYVASEVLVGDVKTALGSLIKKKGPPRDLSAVGLEIKPITDVRALPEILKLQKRVSLQAKEHTYFSHLKEQLEKDGAEYKSILQKKNGRILGVYSGKKFKGLMIATVLPGPSKSAMAGMGFFLDKSIQGKGLSTIGYRLLLEFLAERKVKTFVGGTSQPAIKGLGKVMKRRLARVNYVRMSD